MDPTLQTMILLPVGLGLLGFVEPCTIGGHLIFLGTQEHRRPVEKLGASLVFVAARTLVTGAFGAAVALVGQRLIGVQTGLWLVFGLVYLAIGAAFLAGRTGLVERPINLAPAPWRHAKHPLVLGLAFGLNIPACAAPIMFGLLGVAATSGTLVSGFLTMALFGLTLSLPLVVFTASPGLAARLDSLGRTMRTARRLPGLVFVVLGLWSVWFGFYVDPAAWAGR